MILHTLRKGEATCKWLQLKRELPLLDSLVVECWLRVREAQISIPSQGLRHTKDVIKIVPVVPLLSNQHLKGNTGSFSRINN